MPHMIEVFTGGCPRCATTLGVVEAGKCASCVLVERDLARDSSVHADLVRRYRVRVVPTIVIDGRVKVEGKPDFPWVCGDEFYAWLEKAYPLR